MSGEWRLDARRLGRRVIVYPQTDSTNTRAFEHVGQPDSAGLAFLADEQVAGRGQHGRRWLAAPRSSVLLSVLLYPPDAINRPVLLTAWAAVSVCEVARRLTGVTPRIKWPNDVLLGGRKVCGILIEQSRQGGVTATVAGIGLNVAQTEAEFAAAGLPDATSLVAMGATTADTHAVARELLAALDEHYDRLHGGDVGPLQSMWQTHLGLLGQQVVVECIDHVRQGTLLECGFDGVGLLDVGTTVVLPPEVIRHIHRC
jgi:BirA family transcriptional regulator, biotin operon repressor / biotin---[acetyl-CoA-carboxylase] ligase